MWSAASAGLLWLAARGPRLTAYQMSPNSAHAMAIVGIGQLMLLALLLPGVMRSWTAITAVAIGLPIAVWQATSIGNASMLAGIELATKLELVFGLFATIWVYAPQCRVDRRVAWSIVLAIGLLSPAMPYLNADFDGRMAAASHFTPQRLLTTTILHNAVR